MQCRQMRLSAICQIAALIMMNRIATLILIDCDYDMNFVEILFEKFQKHILKVSMIRQFYP